MARTLNFSGARCDIVADEGSEISFPFQLTAGGQPLDKTGRTFIAEMKATKDKDAPVVLAFTITPGATGLDPLTVAASFDSIPPATYAWDLWEDAAGADRPLAYGSVRIGKRTVTTP